MRRHLDWFVVLFSLLLLAWHTVPDPVSPAFPARSLATPETSPFAYVREDGSLVHLPMETSSWGSTWHFADAQMQQPPLQAAAYRWSSQVWSTPLPGDGWAIYQPPATSASPSWR